MSPAKKPRFIVGIDLGTTHTVVAYADTGNKKKPQLRLFEIEQLIAPGEIAPRALLPSTRYHPAEGELPEKDLELPWVLSDFQDPIQAVVIGELARKLGSNSQGRMVASAKSWLSHAQVDRHAPILPWGAAEEVQKVSPVLASASYLAYVRGAWNAQFREFPLEEQDIVLTIPASFDEMARALTLEAAQRAGLHAVHLVEEPQAAFHDWLWEHKEDLKESLQGIRLLMVLDIGGGTCDFTLIRVGDDYGEPVLDRIGVGDHLMLGGDNIDLTLARLAEQRLVPEGQKLSTANLHQVIEQCRLAKENLLGEDPPESAKITLLGSGSRLIGQARSVELTRAEVEASVLDGFFPLTGLDERPQRKRSGVVEFGLPYVADPAISRQLAQFLKDHEHVAREALGASAADIVPDAILLNGGMFRSPRVVEQVLEIFARWSDKKLRLLENPKPQFAVALGAVAYGLARRGKHIKIGGGSARHYFLQIEAARNRPMRGVCILPMGSAEGQEIRLRDRSFLLRLGEPVRFHLLTSTEDRPIEAGELVDLDDEKFNSLPPLAVTLEGDAQERKQRAVELAVCLSELGILKIQCVAKDGGEQRWDVHFQLRARASEGLSEGDLPSTFPAARQTILDVFGQKSEQKADQAVKNLRSSLEKLLGNRNAWEPALIRELFGVLLECAKNRRRSANHERVWLSLAGFCLRPGFGMSLDDWRVDQIWRIYSPSPQFLNESQNWAEWWTLWRRIAGGLNDSRQQQIFAEIAKYLNPASARQGKVAKEIAQRSYEDIVRLAGVLERLPVSDKIALGEWLIKRLEKPSEPEQSWWALGRIAARVPFHGGIHNVIPSAIASRWLQFLLEQDWKKNPHIAFAATILGRMSGDRHRDLEQDLRLQIQSKLHEARAPRSWLQLVAEVTELEESDAKRIFGESLPPGLRLLE